MPDNGVWYVVGHDLDRDDIRTFRVSRIRGEIKFATRRERDFRTPDRLRHRAVPRPAAVAGRRHRRRGAHRGARRHGLVGAARVRLDRAASRTASSSPTTRPSPSSRRGCCARTAARCRSSPTSCGARSRRRSAACASGHEGKAPEPAREAPRARAARRASARPGPVAPERFAVLQALLAYLLAACGEEQGGGDPARGAARAVPVDPARGARGAPLAAQPRQLRRRLLHDLRRAQRRRPCTSTRSSGATRSALSPRLTPLEARAIRLALEYVGPMIAADAHTPLDKVRQKLEETFGQFELAQTPEPTVERAEEDLISTLARGCASAGSSRSSTRRRSTRSRRRGSSSRTRSSARCRTGTCTRGTARATASARSGSTACAARS